MSYIKWASVLLRDWRLKASVTAKWPCTCNECGGSIDVGSGFYFFGEKDKLCEPCYQEVMSGLEKFTN